MCSSLFVVMFEKLRMTVISIPNAPWILFYTVQKDEEFVFYDIYERPVPSILRGFSAPIRLESDLTDDDLFYLLAHDSDEFNRYAMFLISILLYEWWS